MSTVEVTKQPNRFVTVTKTKNISTVTQPAEQTLEIHDPGVAGPPNSLSIGTVTLGSEPDVTITGVAPSQTLNFVLPMGSTYEHTQYSASASWLVQHNLGFKPNVTVVDSSGSSVEGVVTYTDDNSLVLLFSAAFAGTAYLS